MSDVETFPIYHTILWLLKASALYFFRGNQQGYVISLGGITNAAALEEWFNLNLVFYL